MSKGSLLTRHLFWGVFYLLEIILVVLPLFVGFPEPENSLRLDTMVFASTDAADPIQRALPDNWRHNASNNEAKGTYSKDFMLPAEPDDLWGLFISTHRSNVTVTINGVYVGDGGPIAPILARNYMHPLLLSVPKGLLRKGNNHIEVTLYAAPKGHGFLDPVYIGPYSDLRATFQVHYLFLQTFTQIITFAMMALGAAMLIIWLNRRHEATYGLLAGLALTWALHNFNHITSEIPVPLYLWEKVMHIASLWTTIFGCMFVHDHYLKEMSPRRRLIRKWNWVFAIALSVIVAVLPMSLFYSVFYTVAMPYYGLLITYMFTRMLVVSFQTNTLEARLLTAVTLLGFLYAGHDALINLGFIQSHVYYIASYFGFSSFLFFGGSLLARFLDTAETLEDTNATLSMRVAKREAELKEAFEQQKKYEHRAAMEQERERLMRDIHDGLGGQLVSILSIVEQAEEHREKVASAVRSALDDLRLIVNSLDIHNLTLPALLGLFRERILSRYERDGFNVNWNIEPVHSPTDFSPKKALQILRILQEATTNTQKHAKASEVSISLEETEREGKSTIILTYSDNGIGFDMEEQKDGYGLRNMVSRAAEAGIALAIESDLAKGTHIIMRF